MPSQKKGRKDPPDNKKSFKASSGAMAPAHSFDVDLSRLLGRDAADPEKRAQTAQKLASAVQKAVSESAFLAVPVLSIGDSGRTWSINTSSGRIKITYQNLEGQPVRVEVFRFENNPGILESVKAAIKQPL